MSTLVPLGATLLLAGRPVRLVTRPVAAAAVLVAVMAMAAAFAVDPGYAWIGTPERHFGAVTWLWCLIALVAGMAVSRDRDRSVLLGGVAVAGLGAGVAATAEALGWEPAVFAVGNRLSATLGSPAYLGAATALLLPICAGCAADRQMPRWVRAMATAAIAPLVVAATGSGARAAWVGLATAALVTAVAQREQLRRHLGRAAAAAGAVAIALVITVLVTPVGSRVAATFDEGEPGGRGRIDEWRVATRVIADHPLLGVGPEGYRIAFAEGADASYERKHGRDPLPDRAHSAPLDVALDGGIAALATWLTFLAFTAVHVWRALRSASGWLIGVGAGLTAYVVGSMFLFPLAEVDPVAWMLAGALIIATARQRETREVVTARPIVAGLAIAALTAATAGTLDVIADRQARAAVDALADGRNGDAYRHATDAASTRPDEVRLHLLASRAAVADERGIAAALRHAERALDVSSDDPIARLERATLLVERARATMLPDHAAAARDEIRDMVARDPHNAELRMLEGSAAFTDGDGEAAEAAWRLAAELAPGDPAPRAALATLRRETGG